MSLSTLSTSVSLSQAQASWLPWGPSAQPPTPAASCPILLARRFQNNRRSMTLFHNPGIEPALVTEVLRLSWASVGPREIFHTQMAGPPSSDSDGYAEGPGPLV